MSLETNSHISTSPPPPPPPPSSQFQAKKLDSKLFTDETRMKLERLRQHHFHPSNIPDSPDFGTNQYININEELKQQLKGVVSQFHAPIRYAVAYGSGVFRQTGYDDKVRLLCIYIKTSY